ncbi:MAG TPA: hypothetical protein VJ770_22900 [Stellaceae bacterium]|nr:hypothetical protein [Stellaceae bacterium]
MTLKEVKRCIALLERYDRRELRREKAVHHAYDHPGAGAADREMAVAENWGEKTRAAWNAAMKILRREAGEK